MRAEGKKQRMRSVDLCGWALVVFCAAGDTLSLSGYAFSPMVHNDTHSRSRPIQPCSVGFGVIDGSANVLCLYFFSNDAIKISISLFTFTIDFTDVL